MENFFTKQERGKPNLKFILMIVLIGLFTLINPANGLCQDQSLITIKTTNSSLIDVLKTLETKYKYSIAYNTEQIKNIKGITLNLTSVKIEKVLDESLKNTNLKYTINKRTIVISQGVKTAQTKVNTTREISGKVVDSKRRPLVGASLFLESDGVTGGITDPNGNFKFRVPNQPNEKILVSYIGMKNEILKITDQDFYNVMLVDDAMAVNDVVVTGIFNKSKESYTGAVSVITEKELKTFGNRNLLTTLKNIDPAFNVLENNDWGSDPNKLPDVQMRGANSLTNPNDIRGVQNASRTKLNTPVIMLDGFEISLQRMMDLDKNEVSTITLLKDGSATAMYGSRGANGVIVITTKLPDPGKLKFTYNGTFSLEMPDLTGYDLLNSREKLDLELKSGYFSAPNQVIVKQIGLTQYYEELYEGVQRGIDTYWLSKPLRVGFGHDHNVKLEGGDKGFRYSMNLQYGLTAGAMKGSDRENFNGGINLTYTHKNLIFRNNIMIGLNKATDSPYGTFSQYADLNPYWRAYDDDGKLIKTFSTNKSYYPKADYPTNPMYNAELATFKSTDYLDITNNFSIEWVLNEDFRVKGNIGLNKSIQSSDDFKPQDHTAFAKYTEEQQFRRGSYDYSSGKGFYYDMTITASYSKTFNDAHNIYVGLNADLGEENNTNYSFSSEGYSSNELSFLPMALQYVSGAPTGYEGKTRRVGLLGNATYMYNNTYFIDGSYRIEGASQFGANKRFAPFWSAGIGWNMHNEEFIKSVKAINKLKVRASMGVSGSIEFSPYQAMTTYKYLTGDRYKNWQGVRQMELGNEDLEWQKTTQTNIGLELGLLGGRIDFEGDIYLKKTGGLISTLDLPYANGFSSYTANVGKTENRGFELKATGYIIRKTVENIFWSISGGIVRNDNKIVEISQEMKRKNEELALNNSSDPNQIIREGASMDEIYVVRSLGIDPGTGKEAFLNRFGDMTYVWDARDRVSAGIGQPKYRGNISTMFRYKDLQLTASFGYRFGGQKYNSTLLNRVENADKQKNVDRRVYEDRWMKPGDVKFFKGINEFERTQASSRFVQNESTFLCQNVNITYDVYDKEWLKKVYLTGMRFSVDMGDLFYLSTIRQERGIMYPYANNVSFTIALTF